MKSAAELQAGSGKMHGNFPPRPTHWKRKTMTRPTSPLLPIEYSDEVASAKARGASIVALESTIITHGMPYPGNLDMARSVEAIIRDQGAVPATIAVIHGILYIGLDDTKLEALAKTQGAMKLSRADLAFALAERRTGATTVAATMIAAARAGISVFATGGIGGVHRGAEQSFDISADLDELARTGVIVVCAGAKAILDIPKTLEVLETRGVPVVTYDSETFPAFWSRDSGIKSPLMLNSPAAIANFQRMRDVLGVEGGMLVANPVPEESEIPREEMEIYIARALDNAASDEISGKAVTPYLLDNLYHMTEGRSLETNIALVENNARLAAEIAVALAASKAK
jgi:pseudouridine-5'-phosphate glycosidase